MTPIAFTTEYAAQKITAPSDRLQVTFTAEYAAQKSETGDLIFESGFTAEYAAQQAPYLRFSLRILVAPSAA